MGNEIYIVYAKTDDQGRVIALNSSAFVEDGWGTEIDRGNGDKYHHAQGNYLPRPLYTENGTPRYKLVGGKITERTQEEIDIEWAAIPDSPPTAQEQMRADIDFLAAMTGVRL